MLRRTLSLAAVVAAALALTGCFVASTSVPKGQGPLADTALVGTWHGIDSGDHNQTTDDVTLTFTKTSNAAPLKLVWAEDNKRMTYDVYTQQFGTRMGFAAKLTGPAEAQKEDETHGAYYLGYYAFTPSGDGLIFQLLDKKKVAALIAAGELKGDPGKSEYSIAVLNGTPADIGNFLASTAGYAARSDDPAQLRRR